MKFIFVAFERPCFIPIQLSILFIKKGVGTLFERVKMLAHCL